MAFLYSYGQKNTGKNKPDVTNYKMSQRKNMQTN